MKNSFVTTTSQFSLNLLRLRIIVNVSILCGINDCVHIASIVHERYLLLVFKVHILFFLVYIRFLIFTINTSFFDFPCSPLIKNSPLPAHPIIKNLRLYDSQE